MGASADTAFNVQTPADACAAAVPADECAEAVGRGALKPRQSATGVATGDNSKSISDALALDLPSASVCLSLFHSQRFHFVSFMGGELLNLIIGVARILVRGI